MPLATKDPTIPSLMVTKETKVVADKVKIKVKEEAEVKQK
jgi:hypothetical protein